MAEASGKRPDQVWMQRCLDLAREAEGRTSPNPMVGSVVVQAGEVLGEGYHPGAGHPHAEVFALRAAGDRARGATLYVNLEPCNHTGRTPPCTEAILAAGIRRVVVGMIDPDPRVAGGGVERLRQAGLEVIVGVEETACHQLNEAFIHSIQQQRPFGILKYAMTLDGKIATSSGHSAWVTSPEARRWVHQLRSRCDAIIVGGETVRRDNPHLTSHGQGDRNPLRLVMSHHLDLPEEANLWHLEPSPTWVFCSEVHHTLMHEQLEKVGVKVIVLPQLEPLAVLNYLHQQELRTVLWECGGTLAAQAIAQHCVQKLYAFIAPKVVGGNQAPTPVGELGINRMDQAIDLTITNWQTIGPDWLVEGYF